MYPEKNITEISSDFLYINQRFSFSDISYRFEDNNDLKLSDINKLNRGVSDNFLIRSQRKQLSL